MDFSRRGLLSMTRPALVVFTRDLRIRDNPALVAASDRYRPTLPVFVVDERLVASGSRSVRRIRLLIDSLRDLDRSLGALGAPLIIRRGKWVPEILGLATKVQADEIHLTEDFSPYAIKRIRALKDAAENEGVGVCLHPGVSVVPPGEIGSSGGGEYKVFTPYFRRWSATAWRTPESPPKGIAPTGFTDSGHEVLEDLLSEITVDKASETAWPGGENEALLRLDRWFARSAVHCEQYRDELLDDRASHLSPYLHLGCLSPLEVADLALESGCSAYLRQLCWRDFFLQLLAARPDAVNRDYRHRGDRWRNDPEDFAEWAEGRTGYPLVDAGMRQLTKQGFLHNRVRMVVASFLTKDLYIDWRLGAAFFMRHLVDGDVASNQLNWQWVSGTGTGSNPHRVLNPTRQAERFDPEGHYIRRWIPELRSVEGSEALDPSPETRSQTGYPARIVDHQEAVDRWKYSRPDKA